VTGLLNKLTLTNLAAMCSAGWNALTATTLLNTAFAKIPTIAASTAANALTIGASAQYIDFRSTNLSNGAVTTILATPANLTVPSTATLGTVSGQLSRLIVVEILNAGVAELAVVNLAGVGYSFDETSLISTTAISAASNAANVVYSTTARSNLPFRIVGYIESTQAIAGTWATAPSTIQGAGGNALTVMGSFGYGQIWQNVTGTRAIGTTYYAGAKARLVMVTLISGAIGNDFNMIVNGAVVGISTESYAAGVAVNQLFLVAAEASYAVTNNLGTFTINNWSEFS
jgi:hypothetical protein